MTETFSFGEWVSQWRKALDMTQRELAAHIACTVATIKKIEADERRPSRELAALLADALRVPPEWRETFVECARGLRPVYALATMQTGGGDEKHVSQSSGAVALPVSATSFIGREAELMQIDGYLNDPACRLLTLVGPGGIGKTRLAYQAAAHQAKAFPAGVYAVSLAGVNSPDYLVTTIAERLRFTFFSGDPKAQLLDFLREKTCCWCWTILSICWAA